MYTLQVERLRDVLVVEQIFHHEEIGFRLCPAALEVLNLDGVKPEELRKDRRLACCSIHVTKVGRSEVYENLSDEAKSFSRSMICS